MHSKNYHNKISITTKFSYGLGNLGFGIIFQCLSAYLLFYSTAILGLPGSYIGLIMSIGIFWDAITDPIMGYISDITCSKRWGRRHLYILIGTIAISVVNYGLWNINENIDIIFKPLIIFLYVIILKTFLTMYGTPYTALGAELTNDYNERTSIQGYKTVFFLIGLAFPMVVGMMVFFKATPQYPIGQLNPSGYNFMGKVTSVFMLITGLICFFATRKSIRIVNNNLEKRKISLAFIRFKKALSNRYFIYVFWGYLLANISSALIGSIGLHVFTYTFGLVSSQIALVMGIFFIFSLLSQPLWIYISKRIDKKPTIMKALLIAVIGTIAFTICVFIREIVIEYYVLLIPVVAAIGVGSGGLIMLPPSMAADTIDVEEYETGMRSEGIYYGCMTFGYKVSQSIVLFIVGILLDMVGFDSNLQIQSNRTSIFIGLILCLGSFVAFIITAFVYRKYTLDKKSINKIQEKFQKAIK